MGIERRIMLLVETYKRVLVGIQSIPVFLLAVCGLAQVELLKDYKLAYELVGTAANSRLRILPWQQSP